MAEPFFYHPGQMQTPTHPPRYYQHPTSGEVPQYAPPYPVSQHFCHPFTVPNHQVQPYINSQFYHQNQHQCHQQYQSFHGTDESSLDLQMAQIEPSETPSREDQQTPSPKLSGHSHSSSSSVSSFSYEKTGAPPVYPLPRHLRDSPPSQYSSGFFWVREDRAGAIIGKQGRVIRDLQMRSRTDIQVHNDLIRGGHKLVTVLGYPKQIDVAVVLIAKLVE